jgi:hypothetical protein
MLLLEMLSDRCEKILCCDCPVSHSTVRRVISCNGLPSSYSVKAYQQAYQQRKYQDYKPVLFVYIGGS